MQSAQDKPGQAPSTRGLSCRRAGSVLQKHRLWMAGEPHATFHPVTRSLKPKSPLLPKVQLSTSYYPHLPLAATTLYTRQEIRGRDSIYTKLHGSSFPRHREEVDGDHCKRTCCRGGHPSRMGSGLGKPHIAWAGLKEAVVSCLCWGSPPLGSCPLQCHLPIHAGDQGPQLRAGRHKDKIFPSPLVPPKANTWPTSPLAEAPGTEGPPPSWGTIVTVLEVPTAFHSSDL